MIGISIADQQNLIIDAMRGSTNQQRERSTTEPQLRKPVMLNAVETISVREVPCETTPLVSQSIISEGGKPHLSSKRDGMYTSLIKVINTVSTSVRQLRKSVGFLQGFTLIVGILIGSGVFISPSLVMIQIGDAGFAFLVWLGCGFIALGGALCYCELGCCIKKAGGNYAYILEAYGNLPAFLCSWTVALVVDPSATAAISLTFGTYVMKMFDQLIIVHPLYCKLIAIVCILLVALLNCWSAKAATSAQILFTSAQVIAVTFIVSIGIWQLSVGGHRHNLDGIFNVSRITSPGMVGAAIYNGLWAYDGWALISNVTEEMTNLETNLFLAIITGIPFVIGCYMLINLSFLSALSPTDIANSRAVAITFIQRVLGHKVAYIIPVFVALSCYGALNGTVFAAARLSLAAGREGHLPEVYAMIHKTRHTPIVAVVMTSLIALVMLIPDSSSLETLIGFFNFSCWIMYGMTMFGVIVLRIKRPNMVRPYRVWIITPIIMSAISLYLVVVPFLTNPIYPSIACGMISLGVPFYFVFVYYEPNHPKWMKNVRKKAKNLVKATFNLAPCSLEC